MTFAMQPLVMPNGYWLDPNVSPSDTPAFVNCLNEPEVEANVLAIPSPYREADAAAWIAEVQRIHDHFGHPMHYVIRTPQRALVGAAAFTQFDPTQSHRVEIGYWLTKSLWGQGIMPQAVRLLCQIAVEQLGVARVGAYIFTHNARSARVLEKCGFLYEGILHRYSCKHGVPVDVKAYAYLPNRARDRAAL